MAIKFRLGVRDPRLGDATLWYDMDSPGDAHTAFQLLHDYGRKDITVTVEWLDPDGHWLPAPVRTYPTRIAASSATTPEDDE